jgi:hypothetical protein
MFTTPGGSVSRYQLKPRLNRAVLVEASLLGGEYRRRRI